MDNFTPFFALFGGVLVGLAAVVLWLGNGRIAGISNMFDQIVRPNTVRMWRIVFLASMILAAFICSKIWPQFSISGATGEPIAMYQGPGWVDATTWIILSGLLVGFGTKIGNGCTSGHGICGVGRLSVRSIAATATFFAFALVTVAITGVVK